MPFQDPVFSVQQQLLSPGSAEGVLSFIRSVAVLAGWVVDEYDVTPSPALETGGDELYVHPAVGGVTNPPYFSLKAFDGSAADQQAIKIWMNTGYDSTKRADNQPGMYAQSKPWPTNAVDRTQVFSGAWDTLPNANPADLGMYLTQAWNPAFPLLGPAPVISSAATSLHTKATSSIDQIYGFYDAPLSLGSSRCLIFVWYIDNTMYGIAMGHVLWDVEGVSPDDDEGHLLTCWGNAYDDRLLELPPHPDSLGGTINQATPSAIILELIRNRTSGSETFPTGTPNGNPLMDSGPVVLQQGRIEASDNVADANISAVVRPDQDFESLWNNLQGDAFPNPRITIHREPIVGPMTQERLGFHRPRHISRFPDGGVLLGNYAIGEGSSDWSDSGFSFPIYFAPLRLQADGDTVTEGTRQYMLFPGNRSGGSPYTQAWRVAGLAVRIA